MVSPPSGGEINVNIPKGMVISMAEKVPFFEFFENFIPPREMRLLLHDVHVTGGVLDRENRSM